MGDFLAFRKMITPMIIQIVFWLGVAVIVISALISIASGYTGPVLIGLLQLIVGPIVWRMWCELVIVWFQIANSLADIRNHTVK